MRRFALLMLVACSPSKRVATLPPPTLDSTPVVHSDAEWKQLLGPNAFYILREKGTELPFTGAYADNHASGLYFCAACGAVLFSSRDKFDSGTGWPSFTRPFEPARVKLSRDTSEGMDRTEVTCARCGSHLGHVFDDGPAPTGQRYCINSAALQFVPGDGASFTSTPRAPAPARP